MAVDVACPGCGTRDIRTSRPRSVKERLLQFAGIYNLRCNRCRTRFRDSLWKPSLLIYARCPKCMRTELSRWNEDNYNPKWFTILLLRLGAKPYRCEFCRCNFATFRIRRERFDWSKHRARPSTPAGRPSQPTP